MRAISKYKLKAVLWSNDTKDWKRGGDFRKTIHFLNGGDIILLHDHSTTTRKLEKLLKDIHKKGFKIIPLKELMKSPNYYPKF